LFEQNNYAEWTAKIGSSEIDIWQSDHRWVWRVRINSTPYSGLKCLNQAMGDGCYLLLNNDDQLSDEQKGQLKAELVKHRVLCLGEGSATA
jgi:hypothetical protein